MQNRLLHLAGAVSSILVVLLAVCVCLAGISPSRQAWAAETSSLRQTEAKSAAVRKIADEQTAAWSGEAAGDRMTGEAAGPGGTVGQTPGAPEAAGSETAGGSEQAGSEAAGGGTSEDRTPTGGSDGSGGTGGQASGVPEAAGSETAGGPEQTGSEAAGPESAVWQAAVPAGSADAQENLSRQILECMNEKRAAAGLALLSWSDELAGSAAVRSREAASNMNHVRPDGSAFYTVNDLAMAENLARGSVDTAASVFVDLWMASEGGHKENIMSGSLVMAGVSIYEENGTIMICVLFG